MTKFGNMGTKHIEQGTGISGWLCARARPVGRGTFGGHPVGRPGVIQGMRSFQDLDRHHDAGFTVIVADNSSPPFPLGKLTDSLR